MSPRLAAPLGVALLLLAAAAAAHCREDPAVVSPVGDIALPVHREEGMGVESEPSLHGVAVEAGAEEVTTAPEIATAPPADPAERKLRFRIRVVEADGAPVSGADVLLLSHHVYRRGFFDDKTEAPLAPHDRGATDDDGWAELTLTGVGHGGLHMFAWHGDRAACSQSIWKPEDGQEVQLQLGPAVPVAGVVLDEDGRPCADASVALVVELRYESYTSSIGPYGVWLPLADRGGGAFVFPPVPRADHLNGALIRASRPDLRERYVVVDPEVKDAGDLHITVGRSFIVSGRCVTAEGVPVEGAYVRRPHLGGDRRQDAETQTRSGGEFAIECVPGQRTVLSILGPEQRPVQVAVEERRVLGDIVLPEATLIAGRAVGRDATPIVDAYVGLYTSLPGPSRHATTDADGRFALRDVGAGLHTVRVAENTSGRSKARVAVVQGVRPGTRDLEVMLTGARMVTVHVTFADTDQPPKDAPYLFVTFLRVVDGKEVEERALWDRGVYRFRVQLKHAGPCLVRLRMAGYVTQTERVDVLDDREARVDLVLRRSK